MNIINNRSPTPDLPNTNNNTMNSPNPYSPHPSLKNNNDHNHNHAQSIFDTIIDINDFDLCNGELQYRAKTRQGDTIYIDRSESPELVRNFQLDWLMKKSLTNYKERLQIEYNNDDNYSNYNEDYSDDELNDTQFKFDEENYSLLKNENKNIQLMNDKNVHKLNEKDEANEENKIEHIPSDWSDGLDDDDELYTPQSKEPIKGYGSKHVRLYRKKLRNHRGNIKRM